MLRVGGLLVERCPPNRVDAQIFVQHHEEVVEPALAEAFVMKLGVRRVRRGRLFSKS